MCAVFVPLALVHLGRYVKLALACKKTEAKLGRQAGQTLEHGNTTNLIWDPPE